MLRQYIAYIKSLDTFDKAVMGGVFILFVFMFSVTLYVNMTTDWN